MEDASEVLSCFSPRQRRMLRILTEGSEPILNELLQDLKSCTEQQRHQKLPKQCVTKSTEELSGNRSGAGRGNRTFTSVSK